jgi:hypothetical protein
MLLNHEILGVFAVPHQSPLVALAAIIRAPAENDSVHETQYMRRIRQWNGRSR